MLQGRPLYDTTADARFYVEPQAQAGLRRALGRGNNILIYGDRGSGKTSLLRQLQLELREGEGAVAFVDGSAVDSTFDLVGRIRDSVKGRPSLPGDSSASPGGVSRAVDDLLTSLGADVEPTAVLLDAPGSATALYGLFGRMRDTVWRLPHHWVVAIDEADLTNVTKPPADAFFDTVAMLGPRPPEELQEILERRSEQLSAGGVERISSEARGNPRAAIRAANEAMVDGADPAVDLKVGARLLDAAAALGRPHALAMAELLDLGQASPSDEILLRRLDLKRARANTILQELEKAGLVESGVERSDRPGRPRTVYRPNLRAAA